MTNKISLATIVSGALAGGLVTDAITKIVLTCIAMLVGTTVAFYWRKFLEYQEKKPKRESLLRRIFNKKNKEL